MAKNTPYVLVTLYTKHDQTKIDKWTSSRLTFFSFYELPHTDRPTNQVQVPATKTPLSPAFLPPIQSIHGATVHHSTMALSRYT